MKAFRLFLATTGFVFCARMLAGQAPSVVNNPSPTPNAPTLRVSASPLMRIGGLNDDERYEILGVNAASMTADGQLVVVPRTSGSAFTAYFIRFFDTGGRLVRQLGGSGQGPGEFEGISTLVVLPNKTIIANDQRLDRVTSVDSTGRVLATTPFNGSAACCFADGSFITYESPSVMRPAAGASAASGRPRVPLQLVNQGQSITATTAPIVTVEWGDTTLRIGPFERVMAGRSAISFNTPPKPFGRSAFIGVSANTIVYGINERFGYQVFSQEGRLMRTVQADLPPVPITRAEVAAARASLMQVASTPEMQRAFAAALDRVDFAATMPAFSDMRVEQDGTVWLRNYTRASPAQYWWARFDSTGRLDGTLAIPANRSLVSFARGHVILSQRDTTTDAVFLYVHRIERAGG